MQGTAERTLILGAAALEGFELRPFKRCSRTSTVTFKTKTPRAAGWRSPRDARYVFVEVRERRALLDHVLERCVGVRVEDDRARDDVAQSRHERIAVGKHRPARRSNGS